MTEVYKGERFRHPNVRIQAGADVIPCAATGETVPVTLAVFPDHGTPAFVGSTIRSRKLMVETASKLSDAESQRLDSTMITAMQGLLSTNVLISQGVFKSSIHGKPDIHVFADGDTFKDTCLRLYCHIGEFEGAIVLYQDARTTRKDAGKIESAFIREGRYKPPKNWR